MSAPTRPAARLRRAINALGPGLIAGAAGDDPTGIATYAQAGYGLLWTAVLTTATLVGVLMNFIGINFVQALVIAAAAQFPWLGDGRSDGRGRRRPADQLPLIAAGGGNAPCAPCIEGRQHPLVSAAGTLTLSLLS